MLVATRGREPGLDLVNNGTKISLSNWANQILDGMLKITGFLDNKTTDYASIIQKFSNHISNPELTLSAMLLNRIFSDKLTVDELGRSIGEDYKYQYIEMETSKNSKWSLLEKESVDSKKRQGELEKADNQHFDVFVKEYFNQ